MKKIIVLTLIAMQFAVVSTEAAQRKRNPKKSETQQAVVQSDYQKLMKTITTKAQSKFISIYKNDKNNIFFELPITYFNREMLLGSTLSEISNSEFGDVGYKENSPLLIVFNRADDKVVLETVNPTYELDANNAELKQAFDRNNINTIKEIFPIEAFNADSSAVVINVTKFFAENTKDIEGLSNREGVVSYSFNFVSGKSYISQFKSFEDNLSIKSVMSYKMGVKVMGMTALSDYDITCKVTRSLLLLPQEKMRQRIGDTRMSVFATHKKYLTTSKDGIITYFLANRWRLEPSDEAAYQRGELTTVKKPIVFYIDNSFPQNWRTAVHAGVKRWNAAFEAIGFKDVMQTVDFPENDPLFDPDNLKFSCIRYLPKAVANAMGPSWVDPRTGEIINASVLIYNDLISLINSWRFVQTAQVDPRVRTDKMPQDIVEESLTYAVAHEIGHCLGFMHNMASSAAYDVEKLRDPEFTRKNGTTASIMDYARYNYVAQPCDTLVNLTPPDLGVWDYFTVKWNYTPIYQSESIWSEAQVLEKWIDDTQGDPRYRYGHQQASVFKIDPSAVEEDLGNDPIKASEYGIKNLKFILNNLNKWFPNDPDYAHRTNLYDEICTQFMRYVTNVLNNVGGIYLTDVKVGTDEKPIVPVNRDVQKESLRWAVAQIEDMAWLDNPDVIKHLPLNIKMSDLIKTKMVDLIHSKVDNVLLSSYYATKPYGVAEFLDDVYRYSFAGLLKNTRTSDFQMKMQKLLVENSIYYYGDQMKKKGLTAMINHVIDNDPLNGPVVAQYYDRLKEFSASEPGYAAIEHSMSRELGKYQSFMRPVNTSYIDDSNIYFSQFIEKAHRLISTKVNLLKNPREKAHYSAVLNKLNNTMKTK